MSSLLNDRGVAVPDVFPGSEHDIALRAAELRRHVADKIGLGGWCDSLAWDALFDDETRLRQFRDLYGNRGQRRHTLNTPQPTTTPATRRTRRRRAGADAAGAIPTQPRLFH